MIKNEIESIAINVSNTVSKLVDGVDIDYHIKRRPDGDFLVFELANPTERFYSILRRVDDDLPGDHVFRERITLEKRQKPDNRLDLPEIKMLQRELSQSLTVDRNTFGDDFLNRYTKSVSGSEQSIINKANFFICGRRGAGKSSLLAYAMHKIKADGFPYCWISMQTYSARNDTHAIASVLCELIKESKSFAHNEVPSVFRLPKGGCHATCFS